MTTITISAGTLLLGLCVVLARWIIKLQDKVDDLSKRVAKTEGWIENEEGRRE